MSSLRGRDPPQGLQGGIAIASGTLAARPAAGNADVYYWATDIVTMFRDTGAAWEVVGAQWYERYIPNVFETDGWITNGVVATNRVHYCPLIIERTLSIDRVGVAYDGAAGTEHVYVAIYDSVNEAPVNRLGVSASTLLLSASQKQQVPLTVGTLRLTPGYYFMAFNCDSVVPQFLQMVLNNLRNPFNINHGPSWYEENIGAYGIPPAVATPAWTTTYNKIFVQWVRVASIP